MPIRRRPYKSHGPPPTRIKPAHELSPTGASSPPRPRKLGVLSMDGCRERAHCQPTDGAGDQCLAVACRYGGDHNRQQIKVDVTPITMMSLASMRLVCGTCDPSKLCLYRRYRPHHLDRAQGSLSPPPSDSSSNIAPRVYITLLSAHPARSMHVRMFISSPGRLVTECLGNRTVLYGGL